MNFVVFGTSLVASLCGLFSNSKNRMVLREFWNIPLFFKCFLMVDHYLIVIVSNFLFFCYFHSLGEFVFLQHLVKLFLIGETKSYGCTFQLS